MRKQIIGGLLAIGIISFGCAIGYVALGSGGFKRMVTVSGIYAVCKPGGYEVVCFVDSASKDGGLSCLPLSEAGGKCR